MTLFSTRYSIKSLFLLNRLILLIFCSFISLPPTNSLLPLDQIRGPHGPLRVDRIQQLVNQEPEDAEKHEHNVQVIHIDRKSKGVKTEIIRDEEKGKERRDFEVVLEVADRVHFLGARAAGEEEELVAVDVDFQEQQEVVDDVGEREDGPEDDEGQVVDEHLVEVDDRGVDVVALREVLQVDFVLDLRVDEVVVLEHVRVEHLDVALRVGLVSH